MRSIFTLLFLFAFISSQLYGGDPTTIKVYRIFQNKCVSCHGDTKAEAGLNLQGDQGSEALNAKQVYDRLYRVDPTNSLASTEGFKRVYPGRPDRSYLFRQVHDGLEPFIRPVNGEAQHPDLPEAMTNVEKEMIRQWILFGAPADGEVADEELISEYYNGMGLASFPNGAPEPPAAGEGFQLKVGPFFLRPAGQEDDELEFFQKYETDLTEDLDVNRIDIKISTFSHHFIIYDFDNRTMSNFVDDGLRPEPFHLGIGLMAAVQEATDLKLPQGTAFAWQRDHILDLNTHYINYSATQVYQAESYVNVYTQPKGTAAQEMRSELIVKDNIPIPNNEELITHTQGVSLPGGGEKYIWGLMGHTHKYGKDYKVYERVNGQKGDLIYDASCPRGIPGCAVPFFDYQHIPFRIYEPFMALDMGFPNGIIHEASYVNDGPKSVNFGPTSDDEMMVLIAMYLDDTTGVQLTTGTIELANPLEDVRVAPNPASDYVEFLIPPGLGELQLEVYDLLGRPVHQAQVAGNTYYMDRHNLAAGVFIYQLADKRGRKVNGKIQFSGQNR